jgi:class 3 adenylate cyclase/PAS domain-containing protein
LETGQADNKRETLRGKFLRITIPLIFLSVMAVFAVIELMTHRSAIERTEQAFQAMVRTQAAALANPLWNLDREQISLSLQAIVANREVLSAHVIGEDGKLIAKAGGIPQNVQSDNLRRINRAIRFDAGAGAKTIGKLEFVGTLQFVWQQTWNRLLIAAAIALVAVSIEVAAALYALRTIIGKPLERLLVSINARRTGSEPQPVSWNSTDELGQVIAAYNEMQSNQSIYESDLRTARDTLEERVTERTAELTAARDDSVQARARLDDAINAISEGFSLYGPDDKLVVSNARYREMLYSGDDSLVQPGTEFEAIIRRAAMGGFVADASEDAERWIAARLERHHNPGEPHLQRYANGRWVRVSERPTQDGGTVAVYSDITELKLREEELAQKSSQLEQLSNQLAKYLSPQVYDSIFQGRQEVRIAATRKKLTVFFSDIADFTETADRLESEELTQLLNHYLTEMSRIALKHGATIDKYVGDAILIFFGDPDTRGVKEDALACVQMAIEMRNRMLELEGDWRTAGIARPLRCRMGIHTDYCTVGNFGSEDRLDYTIIGRAVNTASRLESLAEPGQILISYETFAQVSEQINCEEKGEIEIRGLAYPVTTYVVRDMRGIVNEHSPDSNWQGLFTKDPGMMSPDERLTAISRLNRIRDAE